MDRCGTLRLNKPWRPRRLLEVSPMMPRFSLSTDVQSAPRQCPFDAEFLAVSTLRFLACFARHLTLPMPTRAANGCTGQAPAVRNGCRRYELFNAQRCLHAMPAPSWKR